MNRPAFGIVGINGLRGRPPVGFMYECGTAECRTLKAAYCGWNAERHWALCSMLNGGTTKNLTIKISGGIARFPCDSTDFLLLLLLNRRFRHYYRCWCYRSYSFISKTLYCVGPINITGINFHRLNGSSSPVLTATCLSYGRLCDFIFSPTDLEVTPLDLFWRKMAQTTWIHEHVPFGVKIATFCNPWPPDPQNRQNLPNFGRDLENFRSISRLTLEVSRVNTP